VGIVGQNPGIDVRYSCCSNFWAMALSTFAGSPAAAPGAFLGVKGPSTVNPARLPALLGCRDGAATGPNGSTASRWDASPCVWSVASASRRTTRNHCDAHAAAALSPWLPVAEQAMVAISRPRPRDMSWPTSTGSVSPDGAPTCAGPAGGIPSVLPAATVEFSTVGPQRPPQPCECAPGLAYAQRPTPETRATKGARGASDRDARPFWRLWQHCTRGGDGRRMLQPERR